MVRRSVPVRARRVVWLECPECSKVVFHEESGGGEFVSAYHLCHPSEDARLKEKLGRPVRMTVIPAPAGLEALASTGQGRELVGGAA